MRIIDPLRRLRAFNIASQVAANMINDPLLISLSPHIFRTAYKQATFLCVVSSQPETLCKDV
jgi:hypothetical protein